MGLNIAVLASGNGSNLQAIIDRIHSGVLNADIRLVLANKPEAYALTRAKQAGIQTAVITHTDFADRETFDKAMIAAIRAAGADTIVLAGFMRMLTPTFLEEFSGRVINIHPAILPSFPGIRGAADAHEYGVKVTGCTVHFVNEVMDNGPVIIQAVVPVNAGEPLETLEHRIHSLEHRIFPQALQWLSEGRISIQGRTVHLTPSPKASNHLSAAPTGEWLVWPPLEEGF